MSKQKVLTILAGIVLGSGGVYVGLQKPEMLTYEESQVLVGMYNYQIQKQHGVLNLNGIQGVTVLDKLNTLILNDKETQNVKIKDAELTATEYNNLKSALVEKSRQKNNIEKVFGI